jgi:ribosomal protein S18 acetylase RimI-like enzyme
MDSLLRLRLLTDADLPFADSVRALAGWNQTREDWKRLLSLQPKGCFLAEWSGAPAGTALTTVYRQGVGWIGMVLVHPDYRRRGIGRALVQHCIEYLRARGMRCIKLDATPAGRAVYHTLGFQDEWTLRRWALGPRTNLRFAIRDSRFGGRNLMTSDVSLLESLDAAAFGVSRQELVQALAQQSCGGLVLESESGGLAGYGLLRTGSQALYLGPVTAVSAQAGLHLIEGLLAQSEGQKIFWDIPDANTAAVSYAEQSGFSVQRPLTRMFLGENFAAGEPQHQFALAAPETG